MLAKVIGIQKIDYENRQGNRVVGTKLHCVYPMDVVEGFAVESIFTKTELPQGLKLDSDIVVYYNKYGSVECIELVANKENERKEN